MPVIERENQDGIEIVRFAHGPVNALDREFLEEITRVFDELRIESPAAVVLTGAGPAFSAGADLDRVLAGGSDYVESSVGALSDAFEAVFRFPRPLVAAINGHAITGGAVFACACDYRVMARGSGVIGLAELAVGVPFPTYAYEIVRFAVGRRHLQEVVYLARNYSPEDGLDRGLVDEIVDADRLMAQAHKRAHRLARIPRGTFEIMKETMRREAVDAVERYGPEFDPRVKDIWAGAEVQDAIAGFLERLRSR